MKSGPENPFEAPKADVRSTGKAGRKDSASVPAPFQVVCECGRATGVLASQAGSSVSCPCGKTVRVPSLGQLREQAGQDRYETSVADAIRRMISNGELPAGDVCTLTSEPTDAVMELAVKLPRLAPIERNFAAQILAMLLLFGLFGILIASMLRRKGYVEEDVEFVPTPLRVAPLAQWRVNGMSQKKLKRLLGMVPVYKELLEKNLGAEVLLPGFEA